MLDPIIHVYHNVPILLPAKNLEHLWYLAPYCAIHTLPSSKLVVPSFFQSSVLPSFVTSYYPSPSPVCQVIFHPSSSSCHALPPFRCCPYRTALGEILSIRSIFFFFLFCFLLHLYTPARFSRHFLLAITLSLFWWLSFYIVFLNHFHCIELKCFGYFLSIRSYFSFWF